MQSLPIFYKLDGKNVLIAGATRAAKAKIRLIGKTGAKITAVAAGDAANLDEFRYEKNIRVKDRAFRKTDLKGQSLVYIATGDAAADGIIAEAAKAANIPVNVVDNASQCDFLTPAIVERDPITVAIGSGGASPVLIRRIKAQIDALLPDHTGRLAAFAQTFRDAVKSLIPDLGRRRRFWNWFFEQSDAFDLLALDTAIARSRLVEMIRRQGHQDNRPKEGRVLLVGAGPGDPDLLTLKAHRALQEADVIVYDRLVAPKILDYARRDAEQIFVGKSRANHSAPQKEINALLIEKARAGNLVVRLKGGDPLIFGRAGEEIEDLRAANIKFKIIPGVTSALACAATSEIPLTHRDCSAAITLVTGQLKDGSLPDLSGLAGEGRTLAIYMGVGTAKEIEKNLIDAGIAPALPITIVENGTRADERRFHGTLGGLADLVAREQVASPAMIFIGKVAGLAKDRLQSDVSDLEETAAAAFSAAG